MSARSTYIPHSIVLETLESPKTPGGKLLQPLLGLTSGRGVPVNILEDVAVDNPPEIHRNAHDLWQCLEGEVQFVVGGTMTNARPYLDEQGKVIDENEIQGDAIEGGEEYTLKAGDTLFVPAGEPHLHKTKTFARLFIIKIPTE